MPPGLAAYPSARLHRGHTRHPHGPEGPVKEIFIDRCYLRHGIGLDGARCVVGIGASIGMVLMVVQRQCRGASARAFRPDTAVQPFRPSDDQPAASIAAALQEMTGLSDVDPDDDFFDPGGSSPIATRVVARLRAAHGVDVPLRTSSKNPTIAGRAGVLRSTLVRPAAAGPADDHACGVP